MSKDYIMIITHHREKLINAIIYFANNTKRCGKTKLLKLLYFLDFRHFKQTGKSSLSVCTENIYKGELKKEKLLDHIIELLMQSSKVERVT